LAENINPHIIKKLSIAKFRNYENSFAIRVKLKKGTDIAISKWEQNIHESEYFKNNGNIMDGDTIFYVKEAGTYTAYVKDKYGIEDVSSINVKRRPLPFFVALLLLAFLVSLIVGFTLIELPQISNPSKTDVPSSSAGTVSRPVVVSGTASAPAVQNNRSTQPMVTDHITAAANFSSGISGTSGKWTLENAKGNTVIMQAQLFLNGNLIATSLALKPGQKVESIQLSSNVAKGNYTAVAFINYYNLKTQEFISRAGYRVGVSVG
jgi:hypothetical protein